MAHVPPTRGIRFDAIIYLLEFLTPDRSIASYRASYCPPSLVRTEMHSSCIRFYAEGEHREEDFLGGSFLDIPILKA